MKFPPQTLFGQISLALFGVLLSVQIAGILLLLDDRGRLNYKLLAEYSAQRMAGIAAILDNAPPQERPQLVKALSVLPTQISLDMPWSNRDVDHSPDARMFIDEALLQLQTPLSIQMLSLQRIDPLVIDIHPAKHAPSIHLPISNKLFAKTYAAQIRLRDGTVVTVNHMLPVQSANLPFRLSMLLLTLGLATTILSIWAVRKLTRPLAEFADAAKGFAHNLNQAPLKENGPEEIRLVAQSFNSMQEDIRRLVDTRAQALSAVSHDLRLPITRMRLRLESGVPTDVREKLLHDLHEMDAMIAHTLDFLRAGSDTEALVTISLDSLIDSIAEDMEDLGPSVIRTGKCLRPLMARPHALRRCITNLLDNARFYGRGTIHLSVVDSDKEVRITIHDNGPGIPETELKKVFEPYFRLDASRSRHTGGVGLGLPIAKAIAESHAGNLTLCTPPEGGTLATLILPRIESKKALR